MKRIFDVALFFIACAIFSPAAVVIACAIWLEDRGPVLFVQERLGRDRRPFRIYKFRTMRNGVVTRVGWWTRRTGLDELPQFWNILRGDMSFVGPRPLTAADVHRLGWQGPRFDFRWRLRPGITGFSQIHAGVGARHSLAWDRLYLRRCRMRTDINLLALTFLMNFAGKQTIQRHVLGLFRERQTP
jgi:lipopolysaccharide/colanic/teichoic acid biosynthesis glycosyltransferase